MLPDEITNYIDEKLNLNISEENNNSSLNNSNDENEDNQEH